LLDARAYARLETVTDAVADGVSDAAAAAGVELQVGRVPGLLTPFFVGAPVRDYARASVADVESYGAFARGLLSRGVYPPPSQFEAWFPSLAHTDEDVERTIEAARGAFEEVGAR